MKTIETIQQYILSIPAFQELRPSTISALAEIATVITLEEQEFLYHQGERAEMFYLVIDGGVRLNENTTDGREVGLKLYGTGDIFGLLAVSGSYPHPSSVEAIRESLILGFDGQKTREVMRDYGDLALLIVDLLIQHVHSAHSRIREMASEKVDRRLARALLKCIEKFGDANADDSVHIDIALSQQDLANFIGTTVETVNRTLRQWKDLGYIQHSRMSIQVQNTVAIQEIAENR